MTDIWENVKKEVSKGFDLFREEVTNLAQQIASRIGNLSDQSQSDLEQYLGEVRNDITIKIKPQVQSRVKLRDKSSVHIKLKEKSNTLATTSRIVIKKPLLTTRDGRTISDSVLNQIILDGVVSTYTNESAAIPIAMQMRIAGVEEGIYTGNDIKDSYEKGKIKNAWLSYVDIQRMSNELSLPVIFWRDTEMSHWQLVTRFNMNNKTMDIFDSRGNNRAKRAPGSTIPWREPSMKNNISIGNNVLKQLGRVKASVDRYGYDETDGMMMPVNQRGDMIIMNKEALRILFNPRNNGNYDTMGGIPKSLVSQKAVGYQDPDNDKICGDVCIIASAILWGVHPDRSSHNTFISNGGLEKLSNWGINIHTLESLGLVEES